MKWIFVKLKECNLHFSIIIIINYWIRLLTLDKAKVFIFLMYHESLPSSVIVCNCINLITKLTTYHIARSHRKGNHYTHYFVADYIKANATDVMYTRLFCTWYLYITWCTILYIYIYKEKEREREREREPLQIIAVLFTILDKITRLFAQF